MGVNFFEVREGQVDTKNIAANIRYHMGIKGWTIGRLQLHLWRRGIYMHANTLRRILRGDHPMSPVIIKKLARGLGVKRKELTNTIVIKAPRSIDELLMLSDHSMRAFFGGADEAGLRWIRDTLLVVRNKTAERKIAYMKRAGPDIAQVKEWLLTGQISDEAFARIYLDRNTVKPKRLTPRESKEMERIRQRRKASFDRDDRILRRRQGRPSLPNLALHKDPPEYWPS